MTTSGACSHCGAPLPRSAPGQRCPKCLLQFAFDPVAAEADPPAQSTIRVPQSALGKVHYFGDYELLEEIARGGMGVVWKARQVSLNRIVAVKLLLAGKFSSPEFVKRFRAEAEAAANLQHPNIVAIHEVGEHEGQQYFSMDYVEGQNLAQLVAEKSLPAKRAAAHVKTIAQAVHYAHQRGVIHRDLKPSNVLIDANDQPRVTDFGLAKRVPSKSEIRNPKSENDLTLTGQVLGTPNYMSPEQAGGKGREVTCASDVYSLGAILYHLLTGRAPFLADTVEESLEQVRQFEPVSPRLLNPAAPHDLETICLKCLEKESHGRYPTAQELADELQRFLNDEPIRARPVSRPEKVWRWCRRRPVVAGLILALQLVLALGFAGILWQWRRAEQNAANESAQRQRAEEAVTMLELQRAEDLMEKDEIVMGMAYLARIIRQQPTNRIAAQRLLSALTQRNFALPVGQPLQHEKKVQYAEFSPDGRRVATASLDFTARVWDAQTGQPFTASLRHTFGVRVAHFSPDGRSLLTSGDGSEAQLWEIATGRRFGRAMAHEKRIRTAEFSPDGSRILTASDDGTARVWSARTGELLLEPLRHQGPVRCARFSADGQRIVTASDDKTVQVWDAQTGRPVSKPFLHREGVADAEFSPDGKWIVTTAKDYSTCVWDVKSGQPLTKPLIHSDGIGEGTGSGTAKFSPDGERIVVALHEVTRVWNARDWTPLTPEHRGQTQSPEFGTEGLSILTGANDSTARLWDANTGEALTAPMQHDGIVCCARLSPDGFFAVTASADQTARLWDVRPGSMQSGLMTHIMPVSRSAGFSSDGESVVTGSLDGTARIWNLRTGQQQGPALPHNGPVIAVQFSPDGKQIVTASRDGTARLWDARTGEPLTVPLAHGAPVHIVQFSPDAQTLATASWTNSFVRLWNAKTGQPQGEPIPQSEPHVLSFSPDGRRLLSDDFNRDVGQIRDVESHQLLLELRGHEGYLMYGEFSSDGQRMLTASEDGTARIWNARTGKELTRLRHKSHVPCARFSRDDRRVVTASHDATAQLWDTQTGQPVGEPMRHRSEVRTAEFSPDGLLVVTGSNDGTMRLWDASTGRPVTEPFRHRGNVMSARFGPDGRRVLTASDSGEARLWDVPTTTSFEIRNGELLADLTETIIGKRVNGQGALESVSPAGLAQIRQQVTELPRDADFTRWLEWFFADRSTRTISPYSSITIPEYVVHLVSQKTLPTAREAVLLAPTNAPALAHLAEMLLTSPSSNAPVTAAEAEFLRRRAATLGAGGRAE
jgi:eukaryotic-like serine/threonine-protein kinase